MESVHRKAWIVRAAIIAGLGIASYSSTAKASFVFGNFEDGTTDGFGNLNGPGGGGVTPFSGTTSGSIVTPTSGSDLTKVLQLNSSGFNGGQSGGTNLGYDFVASGNASQFMANDIISFQWEVPTNADTGGYSQLYQVVLNAPGAGYTTVGGTGSSEGTDVTDNQYPPYSGQLMTWSFNYDAFKSAITANPGYIQLGITTNNGGGTPTALTSFYFDNFTLSTVPEPTSFGVISLIGMGLLARRRAKKA
jgi:hypothetical protein